jgi:hypothetical protein
MKNKLSCTEKNDLSRKTAKCQIQYKGQSSATSLTPYHVEFDLEVPKNATDEAVLDVIFAGFNNGSGREWNLFRFSHIRSMSVEDMVAIDGNWYECDHCGWKKSDVLKAVALSV